MSKVIFLVGEPGVGKSTLFDKAFGDLARAEVDHLAAGGPARELLWHGNALIGCELGRRLGKHPEGYPGTDAMSMTAIVPTEEWLLKGADDLGIVALEGTRLANKRFVMACLNGGHSLALFHLVGSVEAHAQRSARGSRQDAKWLTGRQTAARNFHQLVERMVPDHPGRIATLELKASEGLAYNASVVQAVAGLSPAVA